ncbi:calcium/calmodulin-dependent protein kinase type 1 [Aphelenchoides avenae]|nr:calcium/calmodulin-dependent protein kinase type 1 [Aphelenchus avenae]
MKTPNILFNKRGDGTAGNGILALIDWQVVFYGNPMSDVANFLALDADAYVRREAEQWAIELYRGEFWKAIDEREPTHSVNNLDIANLTEAYDLALIQQAIEHSLAVPYKAATWEKDGMSAEERREKVSLLLKKNRILMQDVVARIEARQERLSSLL